MRPSESSETPLDNLHRRNKITYYCRFSASRRLKWHENLSLWTITIFSIGLVILPISEELVGNPKPNKLITVLEISSAIVILVYSIIVNKSNFNHRSELFHQCGLELNALDRKIQRYRDNDPSAENVETISTEYDEILKRYENHSNIDFFSATVNSSPNFYSRTWIHKALLLAWYLVEYVQYLVLLLVLGLMFYTIFW